MNAKIEDSGAARLRVSQMRLNSGDSKNSVNRNVKKVGNVMFDINDDQESSKKKSNINFEVQGE